MRTASENSCANSGLLRSQPRTVGEAVKTVPSRSNKPSSDAEPEAASEMVGEYGPSCRGTMRCSDLARELQLAGKDIAYDEIMDAVADFDMVNAKLDAILSQLTVEEF